MNRERPQRDICLGIDYGTCWSKLVFRDEAARGETKSWLVRFNTDNNQSDFRIPSLVAVGPGAVHFGFSAEERRQCADTATFPSLKIRAAFPSDKYFGPSAPLPAPLTAKGLATLTVLYLIQEGAKAVTTYASRLGATHRTTVMMGVPLASLGVSEPRTRYLDIVRGAYWLFAGGAPALEGGIAPEEALDLIRESERAVAAAGPVNDPRQWIRPELAAGLIWAYYSPETAPGVYGAIDVGAGSTDASFFRILETYDSRQAMWQKSMFSFWGAKSHTRGVDAIDRIIASRLSLSDQTVLRGQEEQYLSSVGRGDGKVVGCLNDLWETLSRAFGQAYRKDPLQSHWQECKLFVLGGGSKIRRLRRRMCEPIRGGFIPPFKMMAVGRPSDLAGLKDGEETFAFVAYGLSYGLSAVDYELPSDVDEPPMRDQRRVRLREEDVLPASVFDD